jgi:uncharacterized protein
MRDPGEGVAADGTIRTGVARSRVPAAFEPVLAAASSDASLYVYGSVATGQAVVGRSDVDLLAIGLPRAHELSASLTERFAGLCRSVEIGAASEADFAGGGDEAYGNRVFLRHYCVHVAGPALPVEPPFPADARAARGFNGDIAQHLARWRADPSPGRTIARKTLVAVAGLVSVHDGTWTTDRVGAAARWAEISPTDAADLRLLVSWIDGAADAAAIPRLLDGAVARVAERFAADIGLWDARE